MPAPYPFDPTGEASSNLVTGEQHVLTAMNFQDYHFIVPRYAPFFEEGLVVSHRALDNTVRTLVKGTDYYLTHWFIGGSRGCALPIYGSISFLDLELNGTVTIAYQTLGGDWNIDEGQIAEVLADRLHNPRVTAWEQVSGYPEVFPVVEHEWNLTDMVGMSDLLPKLDAIEEAILNRTETGLAAHIAANNPHGLTPAGLGTMTTAQINALFATVNAVSPSVMNSAIAAAITAHEGASDPHPVYNTDAEVAALVGTVTTIAAVRKPKVLSPQGGETLSASAATIQGDAYRSLYDVPQNAAEFQISTASNFGSILYTSLRGAVTSHSVPAGTLTSGNTYYCRLRYQDTDLVWSEWSTVNQFVAGSATVATPSITAPSNNATGVSVTGTLTASAFSMTTGVDTHYSTDWEIWTGAGGTGDRVFESSTDRDNLTSIVLSEGSLSPSTEYYARVRYRGDLAGVSAWSNDVHFTTASAVVVSASIGDPYAGGFLAGYFMDAGTRYALVVSPRDLGEVDLSRYPYSTSRLDISGSHSLIDGKTNTQLMANHSSGYFKAAKQARSLVINGFNDWYIASRDEAELIFRNLKAGTRTNDTGAREGAGDQGENANSAPPGATYTTSVPGQTTVTAFRSTGDQYIAQNRLMVTSTMDGSRGAHWYQKWTTTENLEDGEQQIEDHTNARSNNSHVCRVVRRVAAPL